MEHAITALFAILWGIAGFLALRAVAALIFRGSRRADVVAAAIVIAFAAGALGPFTIPLVRQFAADGHAARLPEAGAVMVRWPPRGRDVSALCRKFAAAGAVGGRGNVDDVRSFETGLVVSNGDLVDVHREYVASGWALDARTDRPALATCVLVDRHVVARASSYYGAMRPDVADYFRNDALSLSGYAARIPPGTFTHGPHRVEIGVVESSGRLATIAAYRDVVAR